MKITEERVRLAAPGYGLLDAGSLTRPTSSCEAAL